EHIILSSSNIFKEKKCIRDATGIEFQTCALPILLEQCRGDRSHSRKRLHPHLREKNLELEGPASVARESRESRPTAPHYFRGRGRRSARDFGREQIARHVAGLRGKSARLRRSSQGDARRHRGADRRQTDQ